MPAQSVTWPMAPKDMDQTLALMKELLYINQGFLLVESKRVLPGQRSSGERKKNRCGVESVAGEEARVLVEATEAPSLGATRSSTRCETGTAWASVGDRCQRVIEEEGGATHLGPSVSSFEYPSSPLAAFVLPC